MRGNAVIASNKHLLRQLKESTVAFNCYPVSMK